MGHYARGLTAVLKTRFLPIKVKWNLKVQILIWADNPSGLNRVFLDFWIENTI